MKLKVSTPYSISIFAALLMSVSSEAAGQCAGACPPYSEPTGSNLLLNPNFDNVGPCGDVTWYQTGSGNCGTKSAAADWNIHSSNAGTFVGTSFSPTTLPRELGGKFRMLHIQARGPESGVYQVLPVGLEKVVASVWVYVNYGHVVLQANGGPGGPSSWSTKTGEWEQLRICADGSTPVGWLIIWNEEPNGADFYVENAEVKVLP